jgi:hypothetical protein
MIPKPTHATSDNPRYDLFAEALEIMGEREFAWAQVHYENQARKWPREESFTKRDLVRAETVRRKNEQRGLAA